MSQNQIVNHLRAIESQPWGQGAHLARITFQSNAFAYSFAVWPRSGAVLSRRWARGGERVRHVWPILSIRAPEQL